MSKEVANANPLRPAQVELAVGLLWAGFGFGVLGVSVEWRFWTSLWTAQGMLTGLLVLLAVFAWGSIALWSGRRWMRTLLVALVVLKLAAAPQVLDMFQRSWVAAAIYTLQLLVFGVAAGLLFTFPVRSWFKLLSPNKALQATRETHAPER